MRRLLADSTPGCSRLRQRGGCDPCDGGTTGWSGRRGCASAGGSRGSCADGGCSAGTYACSRDSLHSRGWAEKSDHRMARWATLVDQHRAPTTLWTSPRSVVDMRHRSTPVSTCQRYALAVHRVNSASTVEWPGRGGPSPPAETPIATTYDHHLDHPGNQCRVFGSDTPQPVGFAPNSLWTTVDPQVRKLLASGVPGNPIIGWPHRPITGLPSAVAVFGRDKCGHNGSNQAGTGCSCGSFSTPA